jgi:hypothetical protein
MRFSELYDAVKHEVSAKSGSPKPVTFEFLRKLVTSDKSLVESLNVLRVGYTPPIRDARFTLFDERESRHDDPVYLAEISFCAALDDNPYYLLYALTKELMHVFDPMETWINTREKFIQFLRDLQNSPLKLENGSINVEHKARWMAVLALCPEPLREYIKAGRKEGKLVIELAQELGLPDFIIATALDDYYDQALAIILTDSRNYADEPAPDPNDPDDQGS